jgi:low affinity Fe/Cu permease
VTESGGRHARTVRTAGTVKPHANLLERLSRSATRASGTSGALALAVAVILVWVATGPVFRYSDTWQLVINTATTVVTFLMVFLIQRSQNRDSQAVHLKLNEIVAALEGASNRLIEAQHLSESELDVLERHYRTLAELTKKDVSLTSSHSVEEAERRATAKRVRHRSRAA